MIEKVKFGGDVGPGFGRRGGRCERGEVPIRSTAQTTLPDVRLISVPCLRSFNSTEPPWGYRLRVV